MGQALCKNTSAIKENNKKENHKCIIATLVTVWTNCVQLRISPHNHIRQLIKTNSEVKYNIIRNMTYFSNKADDINTGFLFIGITRDIEKIRSNTLEILRKNGKLKIYEYIGQHDLISDQNDTNIIQTYEGIENIYDAYSKLLITSHDEIFNMMYSLYINDPPIVVNVVTNTFLTVMKEVFQNKEAV